MNPLNPPPANYELNFTITIPQQGMALAPKLICYKTKIPNQNKTTSSLDFKLKKNVIQCRYFWIFPHIKDRPSDSFPKYGDIEEFKHEPIYQ